MLATGGYESSLHRRAQRSVQPIGTTIAVTEPLGEKLAALIPAGVAVQDTCSCRRSAVFPGGRRRWEHAAAARRYDFAV